MSDMPKWIERLGEKDSDKGMYYFNRFEAGESSEALKREHFGKDSGNDIPSRVISTGVGWAYRSAKCWYCSQDKTHKAIRPGQATLRLKVVTKFQGSSPRVSLKLFHLECWYKQAWEYLEDLPYTPKVRNPKGKPPLKITPEQRKKRISLLVSGKRFFKELQVAVRLGLERREQECRKNLRRIEGELEQNGGLPKKLKWRF